MSLSIEQLETLRSDSQYARLYIDFDAPSVVFSAQINDTFDTTDLVRDFGFDNVSSGAYTDILPGMTALIGSAPGADDLGRVRVRKAATSSRIFNGAASDVTFVDDAFVTVVDDVRLWRKLFAYADGVLYADEDNAYSDQHANFSPVAMAGPHRRVWLREADLTIEFDGSASYCIGSSISSYSWAFPGAVSTSDTESATPSATYDTPGRYMVSLTVTAANGKTHTARRTLRVFDANDMPIVGQVSDMVGSFADNGFSFQVTVFDSIESVRPGALVTLMARDFYGGLETSIGLFAGAENIVIQGWIAEEGIVSNPRRGSVTFRVETANYWLARMEMQTLDLANVSAAAASWTQIQGMTMAKALHHYLFWRTTLMDIVDVHLPLSDTRVIPAIEVTGQTAGEQLAEIARRAFITPLSDPYNRFFCQVDPQYLGDADRNALPVIMDISKQDRRRGIEFDKVNRPECAMVALSSETTAGTLYSLSPGRAPGAQGRIVTLDKISASSQAESNSLAGMHRGKLNNPYPTIPVTLAANNRAISIAPAQYVEISIAAEDNPRGENFSGRAIPREVEYEFNARTGKFITHLRLEAESFEDLAVDGDPPTEDGVYYPPIPPIDFDPPLPPLPPEEYGDGEIPARVLLALTWNGLYYCRKPNESPRVWLSLNSILDADPDGEDIREAFYQMAVDRMNADVVVLESFGNSIFGAGATLAADGGLTFAPLTRWVSRTSLSSGDPAIIEVVGIHPLTGQIVLTTLLESNYVGFGVYDGDVSVWSGNYPTGLTKLLDGTGPNSRYTPGLIGSRHLSIGDGVICYTTRPNTTSRRMWSSTNGVDWTENPNTDGAEKHTRVLATKKLFSCVALNASLIVVSEDGGATSTQVNTGTWPYNISGASLTANSDGSILLAAGYTVPYALLRSTDGGVNWSVVSSEVDNTLAKTRFCHISGDIWLATSQRTVEVTFDNGDVWEDITGNLATDFGYLSDEVRLIDAKQVDFIS